MRKLIINALIFLLLFSLVACDKKDQFEIAMITDSGSIDDESFNQGTWEGIKKYADNNEITYKYYKSSESSTEGYLNAIDLAVEGGALIIVTPGFLFENSVFISQDKYPEITFILIDGTPHSADYSEFKIGNNTLSITFKEEEAGFLAGYSAVMDGFENFGFMGGIAVPNVVRFGIGYLSGIYYGAHILQKDITFENEHYAYLGDFLPSDDHKNKALSWYVNDVEVIFSAAGGAGASIMSAAEDTNNYVIGVDIDQSNQSNFVLTSALKELGNAVFLALSDYYNGNFKGGRVLSMGANNGGIGLPMETSRFSLFTTEQYSSIYQSMNFGLINVPSNYEEFLLFADDNGLNITNAPIEEIVTPK
ncbi:MAG: BMP family ABC transporter substrate-binding protein [Candidatus Izimaplasma sp.]|nr:BMP family ABC transporter substrate-binding protein [Candidatus Izimaplasma bacterium]